MLISWPATQSSTVTGLGLLLNSSNLSHLLGLFSFTTSCCSPLLQILQFALLGLGKRQPRSSSDQTSIGPLRALALGSFISFFSWHAPSCILPNALMQQWKSFWKWPRPFSFFVPQLTPTERTRRNCGRGEGGEGSRSVRHSSSYTVHTLRDKTKCFASPGLQICTKIALERNKASLALLVFFQLNSHSHK